MDRALTVSSSSRLFFSSTESCVPKMGYKKRGAVSHPSVTSPRPGSDNCSADVTRTRGRAGRQASWSDTPLKPKKAGTKPLSPQQSLNKAVRGKARLCFLFSFLFFPLPLVLYFFSRFFPRYQPRFVPIPVGIARARPPATTTAAEGGVPRSAAAPRLHRAGGGCRRACSEPVAWTGRGVRAAAPPSGDAPACGGERRGQ